MHILYIHQYFATLSGSTGTRSYEFARRWVQAGFKVTVIASIAQLSEEDLKQARRVKKGVRKLVLEGVKILALEVPYHQTMGFTRRIWSFLQFLVRATFLLLQFKKVDVVYASSTPLTVAVPALIKKKFSRTPFVFEVRDPWPEGPIALGLVKNKFIIKLLRAFEKHIYVKASRIVALSADIKSYVDRASGEPAKTIVIPNCADIELFKPLPENENRKIREQLGWTGRFVLIYAGAMGKPNGLDRIIEAAERIKNQEEILFVLIGEGKEKPALEELVKDKKLNNVRIMDSIAKSELAKILPAADVGLMSVFSMPYMQANCANKFFDCLACGLPVLLNYGGWQKDVLDKYNAGLGCDNFNDDEFLKNTLTLLRNPNLRETMAQNARRIAEEKFDRDKLAAQALAQIELALGKA